MKASNTKSLGVVVSKVMATYEDESRDYAMDGSGDCGSLIGRSWDNARNQIVRGFGFSSMAHFLAVVTKRTTARWAYFHGLH